MNDTYQPPTHCCCCLNADNRVLVPATQTVKTLRVCDEHAAVVKKYKGTELDALMKSVRRG